MAEPAQNPFGPENRVDLFVLSMSMARSDLRYAMQQVGKANEEDRTEFRYLLRVLLGHLFDATRALKLWRENSEEARAFLRRLPTRGVEALKVVMSIEQRIGGGALEHNRTNTFHYPCPDPHYQQASSVDALADALRRMRNRPAPVIQTEDGQDYDFPFVDELAFELAMAKFERDDLDSAREQQGALVDAARAFRYFADSVLDLHLRERSESVQIAG